MVSMVTHGEVLVYADTDLFKACRISDDDVMQWGDLSDMYQRILKARLNSSNGSTNKENSPEA